MAAIKGIKQTFREIGKTAQSLEPKNAEKTITAIVRKTGEAAAAPLGKGLGLGGAIAGGTYIATKGISKSVSNITESDEGKKVSSSLHTQKQQELLKIGLTIAFLYILFSKK